MYKYDIHLTTLVWHWNKVHNTTNIKMKWRSQYYKYDNEMKLTILQVWQWNEDHNTTSMTTIWSSQC